MRLPRWLGGRRERATVVLPRYGDPGLVLLVTADDPARADSAVLAELRAAGVALDAPLAVVHLLDAVDAAAVRAELDDTYEVVQRLDAEGLAVHRAEAVSARGLAQERTRMAGLAQRLGGSASGYQLWALPSGPGEAAPPG